MFSTGMGMRLLGVDEAEVIRENYFAPCTLYRDILYRYPLTPLRISLVLFSELVIYLFFYLILLVRSQK